MMLMTKFGKFKLRLIATINLSVLLSVFNLASTTSNYWLKYVDRVSGEWHFAGLWRSCPSQGGSGVVCAWRSGIVDGTHTAWSVLVRALITLGTLCNVLVVLVFLLAFVYKMNKKSRFAIRVLELGNGALVASFVTVLVGFCVFMSSGCNYSMWLHVACMCMCVCTSNLITRTFATMYFANTRAVHLSKSVETAISHSKLACEPEEKIALAAVNSAGDDAPSDTTITMASIEQQRSKVSEANGSNEALIPTAAVASIAVVEFGNPPAMQPAVSSGQINNV